MLFKGISMKNKKKLFFLERKQFFPKLANLHRNRDGGEHDIMIAKSNFYSSLLIYKTIKGDVN